MLGKSKQSRYWWVCLNACWANQSKAGTDESALMHAGQMKAKQVLMSLPECWVGRTDRMDHSTTQRKLRPFWGVWQATRKDGCSRMQKYSRPLAGRPVTVVFWWGKTHTKVKTARLPLFCFAMPFSWFVFCHVKHRHLTTCSAIARKLARPFQALSAKHMGALLYRGTRLAET